MAGLRCDACGHRPPRWVGRCPACGAWGSVVEDTAPATPPAQPLAAVAAGHTSRIPTGSSEFDRVLGGGVVPGSVVLLAGPPGVGKSTLLLQVAAAVAPRTALYVSAEESLPQVRLRATRVGAEEVLAAETTEVPAVVELIRRHRPEVVVVDSVQTVHCPDVASPAGSVAQVRAAAASLTRAAREHHAAVLLVGHVTKEGSVAGPRLLQHLVDVVLTFEGELDGELRLLRASKNRFGPAGEVGCFAVTAAGVRDVADPSAFLRTDTTEVCGVARTVTLQGPRPFLVEIQALTDRSPLSAPRRQAAGLDHHRLALLLAVLERRAGIPLRHQDLYASVVGGLKVREPAADLCVCLAIASARSDQPVAAGVVAFGEVGLAGEVRGVSGLERRLEEAARLGIRRALVPASYRGPDAGLELVPVADLPAALDQALGGRVRWLHRPAPAALR